jgi:hypothetical protein
MSSPDRDLEKKLAGSGDEHQPPYSWKEQVWRRLEEAYEAPAAPGRSIWRAWPIASLAMLVLFVGIGVSFYQNKAAQSDRDKVVITSIQQVRLIELQERVAQAQVEIDIMKEDVDWAFHLMEMAVDEKSRTAARLAGEEARAQLKKKHASLEAIRLEVVASAQVAR